MLGVVDVLSTQVLVGMQTMLGMVLPTLAAVAVVVTVPHELAAVAALPGMAAAAARVVPLFLLELQVVVEVPLAVVLRVVTAQLVLVPLRVVLVGLLVLVTLIMADIQETAHLIILQHFRMEGVAPVAPVEVQLTPPPELKPVAPAAGLAF
jgi:hypothetical protein